jgi:hypothetical protein
MGRSLLLAVVLFASWGMSLSASAAFTRCKHFSGTADAVFKSTAVEEPVKALREAIDKWKGENGVTGPVSEIAEKPRPVPYWRSENSPSLFLLPDAVTDASFTLCWKGVPLVPSSAGDGPSLFGEL